MLAHLGPQSWVKSSYLPGRSGYVLQSLRSLAVLRADLCPRYACRLTPIHVESGKFFLEPSPRFLIEALRTDQVLPWWSDNHQAAAQSFFLAWRSDRIGRSWGATSSSRENRTPLGFLGVRDLALRLEALASTPRPDKHWRGLARAFDDLWQHVPLHSAPLSPLGEAVFAHLRECRQRYRLGQKPPSEDYATAR